MSRHALGRIIDDVLETKRLGKTSLAVFDLDSTLFDLTARTFRIVGEFRRSPANQARFPAECEALAAFANRMSDWDLSLPLERIGLTSNKAFTSALYSHWSLHFFSNEFLHFDSPVPGAVDFVRRIRGAGAEIMYLSGRDRPRMLDGTLLSLVRCGFPIETTDTSLVLKPVADIEDGRFKHEILRDVGDSFGRIWFFENEPVNLNLIADRLPKIRLVFVDSTHSGREQLRADAESIPHFSFDPDDF